MDTWKKVLLTIVYMVGFAGTIFGAIIGVIHFTAPPPKDNSEQILVLETENKQLNEDKLELQNNLVLVNAQLQQKNKEIEDMTNSRDSWKGTAEEYEAKLATMTTERDNLVTERDSLLAQIEVKDALIAEKDKQIEDLYFELATNDYSRLSMTTTTNRVTGVVQGPLYNTEYATVNGNIYIMGETSTDIYVGTENNAVIITALVDWPMAGGTTPNWNLGQYLKVESSNEKIVLNHMQYTALETEGYYISSDAIDGVLKIAPVKEEVQIMASVLDVIEEETTATITFTLCDKQDRVLKTANITLTLHPATVPFDGTFTEEEITTLSNALISRSGMLGGITSLSVYKVEDSNMKFYFNGVESGEEVIFSANITGYAEGMSSTDIVNLVVTQSPMPQSYKLLKNCITVEDYEIQLSGFTTTTHNLYIDLRNTRNTTQNTSKITYTWLAFINDQPITMSGEQSTDLITDAELPYKLALEELRTLSGLPNYRTATFKNGDTIVASNEVEKGTCATAPTDVVVDNKYTILGWSIDGTNVVDVLTIEINEDTTFILLTKLKIDGIYKYKITNFEMVNPEGTFEISNGEVVSFVNLLDSKGQGGNTTFIKQDENTFRLDMRWDSSCKIIVDFIFNVGTRDWTYNSIEFIDGMGGSVEAFTVIGVESLDINGTYSFQAAWRYSATVDCSFTIENGAVTSSFNSGNYTIKNASFVFAYDQLEIFFEVYSADGSSRIQTFYGRLTWNTDTQTWTWKNSGSSFSQGYAVYVVMK